MVEPTELARRLFESQNIQSFIFEPPYADLERFDAGFRAQFFPKEDYGRILRWATGHCSEAGNIYLLEDFFRLCTVIVPLPQAEPDDEAPVRYFVASPFSFDRLTAEDIAGVVQKATGSSVAPESASISKKLLSFYAELPVALSRDKFQSFLCALFPALFESDDMHLIYHYFSGTDSYLYSETGAAEADAAIAESVEKRYEVENAMLDAVKDGDAQTAIAFYKQMAQSGIQPRTPNAIRNLKNFGIVLNSHLRKIMELSGVHPFYVDEVSRDFAVAIEECATQLQLFDLAVQMIQTYCTQIQEHRLKCYSELIQRCITYIEFHYTDYLSLQVLADEVHLNASYLSAQFAKETGSTLTAYINRTRINHALPLLAQGSRTIEDIANTCGFDDMNYFSRVFRKLTGTSPSAYRKQHRK